MLPIRKLFAFSKKRIRNANNPIAQITKRLEEGDMTQQFPVKASSKKLALDCKRRDKYFILINGDVGIVDMMHEEGDITCRIVKKRWLKSFFQEPDDSMKYFIYLMTLNSVNILTATLQKEDIYRKEVCLPFGKNNFVIFPLLHEPL